MEDRSGCQALFPCEHLGLRCDDILYPGRVVYCVQVLVAEICGNGDDGVAGRELRGQLLHGGEDGSGASANKQMVIAHERQTRFDGRPLRRIATIRSGLDKSASFGRKLVPIPGMFRLPGLPPNVTEPVGSTATILIFGSCVTKAL